MKQLHLSTRRQALDPGEWRQFCHEAMPDAGRGAAPVRVTGWSKGGVRYRIEAAYPLGTILSLRLDVYGAVVNACVTLNPRIQAHG